MCDCKLFTIKRWNSVMFDSLAGLTRPAARQTGASIFGCVNSAVCEHAR